MTVLLLTPGFAADESDHNCIPPLQALVRGLLRRGAEVHIIALEYPFTDRPYRWHGAEVYPCNGQNRFWLKPRSIWRAMTCAHNILDEDDFAAIHSFWLGMAAGVGERIAQWRGVPHFTTLMGQDVLPSNRRHLVRLTEERFGRLVSLSAFHNDALEKTTGRRAAHVIPWGLWESAMPTPPPDLRPLDVLGVGSLVAVKNWEKWLRTLALVAQNRPDLQAELIGDGPERRRLERLCQSLGLGGRVHFAGNLPRQEVLNRMGESRALLHTADFESFGFVFPEAVQAGCRVVSAPVGIAPEIGASCGDTEAELAALTLAALQMSEPLAETARLLGIEATGAAYWDLWTKR
jgi:glycosyltransferase involved in cell wall biosynthesis